ncbi:MAG: PKD domain-containing protein [Flavobacteriales bacterium]|nr:PKD domain-containing protein [Flavobacteriales bacterium]
MGQYYEAPDTVTISGFDFYAWQTMRSSAKVTIYCHLFEAGKDSLPSGSPIRSDTIVVDSTFGSGQLTTIRKRALFKPYKTNKPYILVIENRDSVRVGIVSNSYTARDGDQEYLGCGTVGFRWYNFRNLNIGGTPLDCDMALEPHVTYSFYNDFDFKDCYDYRDTMKFKNTSSGFVKSKMYNRYAIFNIERFCHYWDFGDGFRNYMVEGERKYNSARNAEVRLYTSHYALRGNQVCRDTTVKQLYFQPTEISFSGNANLCSGESAVITANTNGEVKWFNNYADTTSIAEGPLYGKADMQQNDTIHAQSYNGECKTNRRSYLIRVTKTPQLPTVSNDSVCTGAKANLSASSDLGTIYWFTDSMASNTVFQGDVLEIGPLKNDTFFFVRAFNGKCVLPGSVKVGASVGADFAPLAPQVITDTSICLLDGPITLHATAANSIRWFSVPGGGNPIQNGSNLSFTPTGRGVFYRYVDAFDGRCPSSRVPVRIEVGHFGQFKSVPLDSVCQGDSFTIRISDLTGNTYWYDDISSNTPIHTGSSLFLNQVVDPLTYYLQPFDGICLDTMKHAVSLDVIPIGEVLRSDIDKEVCSGTEPQVNLEVSAGVVKWFDAGAPNPRQIGSRLRLGKIETSYSGNYVIDNMGCLSEPTLFDIGVLPTPDAVYDYQVNSWRLVEFAARYSGKGTYAWDFDENGITANGKEASHRFASDGTFNVQLIIENDLGCSDTSIKSIVINTVGIEELTGQFSLYPNPAKGEVQIKSTRQAFVGISLLNTNGQQVLGHSFDPVREFRVELPKFLTGLYVLESNWRTVPIPSNFWPYIDAHLSFHTELI